jgi:pimeloyl-ACP methyl ester carboxylesterase
MPETKPIVVLVHGAFAESASWNGVLEQLRAHSIEAVAVANPLRGVATDGAYVRDVITGLGSPVVLVGHSYGGFVITEASSDNDNVRALVYVNAFAPEHGENAFELSTKFPGSTLGETLDAYPLSTGGNELAIRRDLYHDQFCADAPTATATLMAATQRAVTEAALTEGLPTTAPGWTQKPSWFVMGDLDRNIPIELQRYLAERAGSRGTREVTGASHAISVSRPTEVTASILDAIAAVTATD